MSARVYSGTSGTFGADGKLLWIQHPKQENQIYIDVDTSQCGFKETPLYVCSLVGNSHHWSTTGGSCIYQATARGFRINVRNSVCFMKNGTLEYDPLKVETARKHQWRIDWMAVEKDEACD